VISINLSVDWQKLIRAFGNLPAPASRPVLVVVSGLPGTGKTTFARKLAEQVPVVHLESDMIRKLVYPYPTYSSEESASLFTLIHRVIEYLLNRKIPVLLDATNLREQNRQVLYDIAEKNNAGLILVFITAPPDVVRQRMLRRQERGDTCSDADWQIYLAMAATVDPIQRKHYIVDTSQDYQPVLNEIIHSIRMYI